MVRRRNGRDIHGILLLDKSLGESSNKALQTVRQLFQANKAGHTGTLDPMASGLLPVCFGEATKVSSLLLNGSKRYQVVVQLGVMTETGDREGAVLKRMPVPALTQRQLNDCFDYFTGDIDQLPPMYSAVKYQGRKLYQLAREGKVIERQQRRITIFSIEMEQYASEQLTLHVHCSKGTYIRVLAEDIGHYLGCCATVNALRRTASGGFTLDQATSIAGLQSMSEAERFKQLIAVDKPLEVMPAVHVSREQAQRIRHGQQLKVEDTEPGTVRMYCEQVFLGLGEMLLDGKLAPKKLFNLNNEFA